MCDDYEEDLYDYCYECSGYGDDYYMGDDGKVTYYVDMVERKFAQSSTAPFNKRYDLLDSVDDMFEVIINS